MTRIGILVAFAALALAASAPTALAAAKTFNLETNYAASGWVFRTANTTTANPTLDVDPSDSVTVKLVNNDPASNVGPHNFKVNGISGSTVPASGYLQARGANATVTFTIPADKGKEYTYVCEVHPTTMMGKVKVSGTADTGGAKDTPGFELALLAAAGVGAALVVRRRLA